MAEVGKVEYKAKVNTSGLTSDMDEVEKKIKKAGENIDEAFDKASSGAKKAGDSASSSGEKIENALDKAAESAKDLEKQLDDVGDTKIDKVAEEAHDAKTAIDKLEDSAESAKKDIDKIGSEADDAFDKVEDGADDAKSSVDKLENSTGKVHTALGKLGSISATVAKTIGTAFVAATAGAAAGVGAVVKMGIEYNAQMQSYQTAFTTMLGDAEKAQALTDNLKTLAAKTPLAMTDLADASKILLAFGSSAEELPDQLKRLGDVAQGDAQALGTMATAFGRVQSNGYASLEEINMMIDQGFNPLQIIAEKTGETMSEVRDRVSAGGVSFEELADALETATSEGGQFFNAMENQSKTFEGQMSTLKDNVASLSGTLTEDLFGNLAENTLPKINDWVLQISEAAEEGGVEAAIETAGTILSQAVTELLNGAPQFIETASSLVNSFLQGIIENSGNMQEGASATIGALIDAFLATVPNLIDVAYILIETVLQTIIDNSGQMENGAVELVLKLADAITSLAPLIVEAAAALIFALVQEMITHYPEIQSVGWQVVTAIIAGIGSAIGELVYAVYNMARNCIDGFKQQDWSSAGSNIVSGIIRGLTSAARNLLSSVRNLASNALSSLKSRLGIHSPSKVMKEEVGEPITEGIAVGMEDMAPIDEGAEEVTKRLSSQLTYDMNYNLPNTQDLFSDLSSNFAASFSGMQVIEIPLYMDGREVARATAWRMGEQLSWEEM